MHNFSLDSHNEATTEPEMIWGPRILSEEVYQQPMDDVLTPLEITTTYVTPNFILHATFVGTELVRVVGRKVKVVPIEMNHVRVTDGKEVKYYEIGQDVLWLEGNFRGFSTGV